MERPRIFRPVDDHEAHAELEMVMPEVRETLIREAMLGSHDAAEAFTELREVERVYKLDKDN